MPATLLCLKDENSAADEVLARTGETSAARMSVAAANITGLGNSVPTDF